MMPFEILIPAGNTGSVSHETGGGVLSVTLPGAYDQKEKYAGEFERVGRQATMYNSLFHEQAAPYPWSN